MSYGYKDHIQTKGPNDQPHLVRQALHISADKESQKILVFRVTTTSYAGNLPGMLYHTLDRLDVPLKDRDVEPDLSVGANSAPADENSVETITKFVYRCCQTMSREMCLQGGGSSW